MEGAARALLVSESRELLAEMERALLEFEASGASAEGLNAAFRAAHTIKGSAGMFGLELIVGFTQTVESVLERVRSGSLPTEAALVSCLLRCCDYVGQLVNSLEQGSEQVDPDPATRAALLDELYQLLQNQEQPAAALVRTGASERAAGEGHWHLSIRFGPQVMKRGMDPISFIVYLRTLGKLVYLHTRSDDIPAAESMDPELCYLAFEIGLRTAADRRAIEAVFDFVREDSQLKLLSPESGVADYIRVIEELPSARRKLGELLVASGALRQRDLDLVLAEQARASGEGTRAKLGEALVSGELVPAPVVAAALNKQRKVEERRVYEQRVVKVDAGKLDQLINLVGELVIASEGARLLAARSGESELVEAMGKAGQIIEQVRDRALGMRMIPIGEVFQRFPRVVRDVSRELGKEIELVITGAESELDKSMVDKLADPLLHLVRNAIDHGIEPVAERLAAGKRAEGRLHLHAFHESGYIVIEISEDGRGLSRKRIMATAIERGLIDAAATLSDAEVHQLLFLPGFSTASAVTNLSGRGVGMDVVKRSVEQLRGEIEIESEEGVGTRFRIRLPLTLAIIDGFQVALGETTYVIPLETVEECVDMSAGDGAQRLLSLRGEPLPYLRLRELFKLEPYRGSRESVVVVSHGQHRVGLVVDRLLGDFQAVIKPLGPLFRGIRTVSSSTILGDGTVALILDIPTLVARASEVAQLGSTARGALH